MRSVTTDTYDQEGNLLSSETVQVQETLPEIVEAIRAAFIALPDQLQDKYEDLILTGAFHLERGNFSAVARKLQAAGSVVDANDPVDTAFFNMVQGTLGGLIGA